MQALARETVFELAGRGALTDEEVVRRVAGGEVQLFEVLMRRHNQKVYRAVRALIRDEAECEDVMQQAYLSAYLHLDQFAGASKFTTWLIRIAINEALGRLRRQSRFVSFDDAAGSEASEAAAVGARPPDNPEARAMSSELAGFLKEAVDTLPEKYSVVFMLREVEGMDTAATAEALGVSEEVVKTRLLRARSMLRKQLYRAAGPSVAEAFPFIIPRCDAMVARVFAAIEALEDPAARG